MRKLVLVGCVVLGMLTLPVTTARTESVASVSALEIAKDKMKDGIQSAIIFAAQRYLENTHDQLLSMVMSSSEINSLEYPFDSFKRELTHQALEYKKLAKDTDRLREALFEKKTLGVTPSAFLVGGGIAIYFEFKDDPELEALKAKYPNIKFKDKSFGEKASGVVLSVTEMIIGGLTGGIGAGAIAVAKGVFTPVVGGEDLYSPMPAFGDKYLESWFRQMEVYAREIPSTSFNDKYPPPIGLFQFINLVRWQEQLLGTYDGRFDWVDQYVIGAEGQVQPKKQAENIGDICTTATCTGTPPTQPTNPIIEVGKVANVWGGEWSGIQNPSSNRSLAQYLWNDGAEARSVTNGQAVELRASVDNQTTTPVTVNPANHFGDYKYTAWGEWSGSIDLTPVLGGNGQYGRVSRGHWVLGQPTIDTPAFQTFQNRGTATYNGTLMGNFLPSGGGAQYNVMGGQVQIVADFKNGSLSGGMDVTKNGAYWSSAYFSNISIYRVTLNNNLGTAFAFNGNQRVSGDSSHLSGAFYGPLAEEVGGGWNILRSNGEGAVGVFRAKR